MSSSANSKPTARVRNLDPLTQNERRANRLFPTACPPPPLVKDGSGTPPPMSIKRLIQSYADAMNRYPTFRVLCCIGRSAPFGAVITILALLFAGCAGPVSMQPVGPLAPFGHDATLIYVPGIGGRGSSDAAWVRGLRTGGYEGKAEIFDWTGPLEPVAALWDHRRHRQQARHIADRIRSLRAEAPDAPIILVGHSAGAGPVVLAQEDVLGQSDWPQRRRRRLRPAGTLALIGTRPSVTLSGWRRRTSPRGS